MEFWLIKDKEKLHLPVPPPNYDVTGAMNNSTINVENIGEINMLGRPKLKPVTISSFFPAQEYSFCQYSGFPNPNQCVDMIEKWKNSLKPIQLIITGTRVNMFCSIESFKFGEKDGTGDIYFTLELKEYKTLGTMVLSSTNTVSSRPNTKNQVASYTVKTGDTLSLIAKKVYGDSSKYTTIVTKNGLKNPNAIKAGQVLQV